MSALDAALRALRHRDRSSSELRRRLAEQGYGSDERDEAIETLLRTGLADDARYAEARARALAERGAGDLRIRHELGASGHPGRAGAAGRGRAGGGSRPRAEGRLAARGGAKTARYLHGKGFSEDVIAGAVAGGSEDELG